MNKRIISLVLALVMVLGTFSFTFAEEAVDGPTDNEKVNWLIEEGLVKGDEGTGEYRLADPIKRSEVAAMVVRARGQEDLADSLASVEKFPDVLTSPGDKWANGYINVAAADGIVKGYEDGTFRPANNITKAEAVAMMVRVAGGLSEEEEKLAVGKNWAAPYLIKAAELGILEGVELGNANEAATREFVFELVYNTLQISETGRYNILKGIVLENYRVESLDKDEIVIEVIREVQRANYAEKSRAEEGDQIKLVVPAKVADVENLLGKVADFTINEKDEVVRVKIDDSYEYVQGAIEATKDRLTVGTKRYTVELDERYEDRDERIFRSYFNNEDFAYRDFYRDEDAANAEFARVTVKNGKVLFIDAFTFDDIAPVAKDIDSRNRVEYYDDLADGETSLLTVGSSAYVLNYIDGELYVGSNEDIAKNDVIHWFTVDKQLTVVVRPAEDNMVEGTYEEVNAAKAKAAEDINITVDGEDYPAYVDEDEHEGRIPVYSYTMDIESFKTLTEDYDEELDDFEDEEVVLLLDMFGFVQLIGSEYADTSFYAIVTDTSRAHGEIKLLDQNNENNWYSTDRDTKFVGTGEVTQDKKFDKFNKYDLVNAVADDELLTRLELLKADDEGKITELTKDVIEFAEKTIKDEDDKEVTIEERFYYVSKNVVLFVADEDAEVIEALSISEFKKKYDTEKDIEGYVVLADDEKMAEVIVITKATLAKGATDTVVAKVTNIYTGKTDIEIRVQIAGEEDTARLLVDDDDAITLLKNKTVVKGSIVELELAKTDAREIKGMELLLDADNSKLEPQQGLFKVEKVEEGKKRGENYITLSDRDGDKETFLIQRDAAIFGDYSRGDLVAVIIDEKYELVEVLDVRSGKEATGDWDGEPAPGEEPVVVTYIATGYDPRFDGTIILLDRNLEEKNFNLEDFDELRIGETVVSLDVMNAWLAGNVDEEGAFIEVYVDVVTEDGKEILVVDGDVADSEDAKALVLEEIAEVTEITQGAVEEGVKNPAEEGDKGTKPEGDSFYKTTITLKIDTDYDRPVKLEIEYKGDGFKAYLKDVDGGNVWYENPPVWGPAKGFSAVNWKATTPVYFTGNPGVEYTITIKLVDAEWNMEIASETFTFTIPNGD